MARRLPAPRPMAVQFRVLRVPLPDGMTAATFGA
jgi:hypothetical protein